MLKKLSKLYHENFVKNIPLSCILYFLEMQRVYLNNLYIFTVQQTRHTFKRLFNKMKNEYISSTKYSVGIFKTKIISSMYIQNLPAMQETWVQFLGWEDALEKEMAIHSSILAWKIPWTEEPGGLQSMGSQRVRHDLATKPNHMYT